MAQLGGSIECHYDAKLVLRVWNIFYYLVNIICI